MLDLVLSLDYEVFGNGAGDVRSVVIEPTARILDICDRHGAKLSIMFEMAEYLAMKEAYALGKLGTHYDPAREMEEQVLEAVARGHDVQLHIHPQWLGAEFHDGVWHLKMEQYRIADLPGGYGSSEDPQSILGAMSLCKDSLETMIRKRRPDYRCRVFRAGGFLVQPSQAVVDAMVETGIMVDSSVVKGLAREAPYQVDFRQAEGHRDWWVADRDDVSVRGSNGSAVLECPVYSFRGPYLLNFMPAKLWAAIKRKKVEKRDPNSRVNAVQSTPGLLEVARKVFGSHVHTLDFCKLSAAKMSRIVAREQAQKPHGTLVFIGHSKDFWNDEELDGFLRKLCRLPGARVCTFDELLSRVAEGPTSDDGARD